MTESTWRVNAVCGLCGGSVGTGRRSGDEFVMVSSQCAVCHKGSASFIGDSDFTDPKRRAYIAESCKRLRLTRDQLKALIAKNAVEMGIGRVDDNGQFCLYTYDEYMKRMEC